MGNTKERYATPLSGRNATIGALGRAWHPRQEDVVARVAEAMKLPLHVADQLYAQMLESLEISEPLDKDNPWCMLNDSD